MPDNEMKIKIQVQNQKANKSLKETGKNIKDVEKKAKGADNELSRMRIATSGLRRSMGALRNNLLLVSFAFGGMFAGMAKALKAAGEQELAETKLSTALGHTSQALLDQATALQSVTTFGDENIIQAQALIAAFTDDEEAIKRATAATLDLAAAKGMDLFAAADLVAKTLGSSTNAMSRYGIEVTGAVGSTERLDTLTNNIAKTFGGQATAQAETFSGKMAQMSNVLGDAAEAFGELLFPLVYPLAEGLKLIGENAIKVMNIFKKMITKEEVDLIIGEKLAFQEFQKTIKDLSQVDLVHLAIAMDQQIILSDVYTQKLIALRNELEERGLLEELEADIQIRRMEKTEEEMSLHEKYLAGQKKHKEFKEKFIKVKVSEFKIEDEVAKAREKQNKDRLKGQIDLMKGSAALIKQFAGGYKIAARLQQTAAMVDAFSAANAAIATPPKGYGPTPIGWTMYAAALSSGIANAMSISKSIGEFQHAQFGMDQIVDRPTLIMAGENNQAEQVSITPLEGPNLEGPQGGSITVNISGNVLQDDWIETELSEKISDAIRRGVDFGIS